jgi:CRISPR-associated protein Cas5t
MRVLKVAAEGLTTSFRYPHFMQGIHPSFPMPPPATIYGHICSALGEWFDPAGVRFAYHFTHEGTVRDIEHVIVLGPSTGKLPNTKIPKVLKGNVNPFEREMFFRPRLTLYINRPEWEPAFRSPRYAVVLGRSQDLFTYTSVSVVELEQADAAYFEHTLAPHSMALQMGRGVTVLMPRFVDHSRNRTPTFERYVAVEERVTLPNADLPRFSHLNYGPYWVDHTAPVHKELARGLAFLGFDGEDG